MNWIRTVRMKHNRSLTFRFVFFVGLLVMAVLVLIASFLVVLLSRQAHQERLQVLQTSLSHTDVLFSQHLSNMEIYCQDLYSTETVRRIRAADTLTSHEQVHGAQEIQTRLRNTPYIHSVYVVNQDGVCNFHTTNSNQFLEDLSHRLPEQLAAQSGSVLPFLWTVESRYAGLEPVPLLSMYMQAAQIGGPYYTGTVVVNCDLNRLSNTLFSSVENSDILQYFVLDYQGQVVVHSKRSAIGSDFSAIPAIEKILAGSYQLQQTEIDGVRYEFIAMACQYPGYYVVAQSVYQPQSKLTAGILLAFPLAILALCMLCMCVSYMVGRKMFSPLRSLVSSIRRDELALSLEQDSGDELQYLKRYYNHISAYVERLKNREEKNLIVKNLLLGNSVQPLLLEKQILYPGSDYCAILIYMLEDAEWESLSDYYQWQNSISEAISQAFQNIGQCSWLEMDFHRMLFLLTQTPEQHKNQDLFSQVTNALQRMMEPLFANRVLVYAAYNSSDEDLLALYRNMDGRLRTALCLNSNPNKSGNIYLFRSGEDHRGSVPQLSELVQQVVRQVQQEERDVYLQELNRLLDAMAELPWEEFTKQLNLLAEAVVSIGDAIPETAMAASKLQQLRAKIQQAHERQALLDCFLLLYDEIVLQRQKINGHSAFHTMEYAVSLLKANYSDCELNMTALAKKLNVSPSYFGKLFHDHTGKTVSDYLTELRMERARELLLQNPERSIVQIAADVGYPSPSYFATKFKKHFGVSPSSLRNYAAISKTDPKPEEGD